MGDVRRGVTRILAGFASRARDLLGASGIDSFAELASCLRDVCIRAAGGAVIGR